MVFLDTHVVIWLFDKRLELISTIAGRMIRENEIRISPIVLLELTYLHDIGKIGHTAQAIASSLSESINMSICTSSFEKVIAEACKIRWTRDPFDRIITGQAMILKSPLITKDATILKHYSHAIWD